MRVGFDLDGTLECPWVRELLYMLLDTGHEVHIITGVFADAPWQDVGAKIDKLQRLRIPFTVDPGRWGGTATVHFLKAIEGKDRDFMLADLGLRKGELCERLGIDLFIDDSELYCEMIPKFSRNTRVLQVK